MTFKVSDRKYSYFLIAVIGSVSILSIPKSDILFIENNKLPKLSVPKFPGSKVP